MDRIPFENNNRIITKSDQFLGILYGIGYNINYIIGAGIFNSNSIWKVVQSPGIALMLYVGCGIISILGSLIYIELGIRSLPSGIGEQRYITNAFPSEERNFGHIFSFVAIFIILPGEIVADSYISAQYLLCAIRGKFIDDYDLIATIVSVIILLVITIYQVSSNKISDIINQTLALIKILTLLIISIVGLANLSGIHSTNWRNIFNTQSNYFGAYGNGLIKVLFAYEGWNNINYLIGKYTDPNNKNPEYPSLILKCSSIISICISFLLYFFINVAFITVVGKDITNNESIPIALRFGNELLGGAGGTLMSILVAISAFGSVSTVIFTYARIIKYAAETNFLPKIFNSYRRNTDTLTNPLLIQFCYCLILILISSIISNNYFEFFAGASQYSAMIFHGASAYCLWILKKRLETENTTFSVPIYIIIFYLLTILFIIIASLFPPDANFDYIKPYFTSWVVIIFGGIICYLRIMEKNEKPSDEINPNEEIGRNEESNGGEAYEMNDLRNSGIRQNTANNHDN